MKLAAAYLLIPALLAFTGCESLRERREARRHVDFEAEIKPMLELRCLQCHNSETAQDFADLNLETRELAMTTGRNPPVINAGNGEGSLLYQTLKLGTDHPMAMPPSPDKIWEETLEKIRRWIDQGAEWPEGEPLRPPA